MKTRWYTLLLTLVILVVGAVFGVALGGLISSLQKGENQTEPNVSLTTPPPTTTPAPTTIPPPTTRPPTTAPPTTRPPTTTSAPTTTPPPTTAPPPTAPVNVTVLEYTRDADYTTSAFVKWNVSGGAGSDISATMVRWSDTNSTGYDYKYNTTALSGKTPQVFSGNFTTLYVDRNWYETYYFRVYARVDGRDYYSPEYTVTVYGKKT